MPPKRTSNRPLSPPRIRPRIRPKCPRCRAPRSADNRKPKLPKRTLPKHQTSSLPRLLKCPTRNRPAKCWGWPRKLSHRARASKSITTLRPTSPLPLLPATGNSAAPSSKLFAPCPKLQGPSGRRHSFRTALRSEKLVFSCGAGLQKFSPATHTRSHRCLTNCPASCPLTNWTPRLARSQKPVGNRFMKTLKILFGTRRADGPVPVRTLLCRKSPASMRRLKWELRLQLTRLRLISLIFFLVSPCLRRLASRPERCPEILSDKKSAPLQSRAELRFLSDKNRLLRAKKRKR